MLLGVVREVTEEYAVISLPNMLTGFVQRGGGGGGDEGEMQRVGRGVTRVLTVGTVLPVTVMTTSSESNSGSTSADRFGRRGRKGGGSEQQAGKRRIELSVDPSALNRGLTGRDLYAGRTVRGRVVSCEDHGCVIDLGMPGGGRAFLKYDAVEGEYEVKGDDDDDGDDVEMADEGDDADEKKDDDDDGDALPLNPGRVYDFVVDSSPSASSAPPSAAAAVQLRLPRPSSLCRLVTDLTGVRGVRNPYSVARHTLGTLRPGMMVEAEVEHCARNGLCVSFLGGSFRGAVEGSHLGGNAGWSSSSAGDAEGGEGDDKKKKRKSSKKKSKMSVGEEMWWKEAFSGKNRMVRTPPEI